jgi:hypothetical protein
MAAARVLALILAGGVTGHAETDVFMRTVGRQAERPPRGSFWSA